MLHVCKSVRQPPLEELGLPVYVPSAPNVYACTLPERLPITGQRVPGRRSMPARSRRRILWVQVCMTDELLRACARARVCARARPHTCAALMRSCATANLWCHTTTWGADIRRCCPKACKVECGPSQAPTSPSPTKSPTTLQPTQVPTAHPIEQVLLLRLLLCVLGVSALAVSHVQWHCSTQQTTQQRSS